MRLHHDDQGFAAALRLVGDSATIRQDVLEKDYYVTLLLKELAGWQNDTPAYFKGGTALYKALGSTRRFSEDIDITVCIDDCSKSQAKRRLEKAANGYQCLPRTTRKELESNHKGSITSIYDYRSKLGKSFEDPLQRFGHVKVEATSFTVSEPFLPLTVAPLIYEKASEEQKKVLQHLYGVEPFLVKTIKLERIYVDKIFAAEFYYLRKDYFDVSKHLYDIAILSELEVIRTLLGSADDLTSMIALKRREEKLRIGSDLSDKPIRSFEIFESIFEDKLLRQAYDAMQDIYIFDESDHLDFQDAVRSLYDNRSSLFAERFDLSDLL